MIIIRPDFDFPRVLSFQIIILRTNRFESIIIMTKKVENIEKVK